MCFGRYWQDRNDWLSLQLYGDGFFLPDPVEAKKQRRYQLIFSDLLPDTLPMREELQNQPNTNILLNTAFLFSCTFLQSGYCADMMVAVQATPPGNHQAGNKSQPCSVPYR